MNEKNKSIHAVVCWINSFFVLSLTIHAKTEFKVSIDIEKDKIEFKYKEKIFSKSSFKNYEMVSENVERIAHHLLSLDEVYGIILYKGAIKDLYTLEGFLVLENGLKTCLQKISKEEYEYLIEGAEKILDTSELGIKLKRNQGRFEAYHAYVFDEPRREEIETYALERHGRSLETMTSTDEYLK